jgi:hypothetical protein
MARRVVVVAGVLAALLSAFAGASAAEGAAAAGPSRKAAAAPSHKAAAAPSHKAAAAPSHKAAAAPSHKAAAKIVCFKRTVRTRAGRKVRRKVCRARRKVVAKRPAAAPVAAVPAPVVAAPVPVVPPVPVVAPGLPGGPVTPGAPAPACVPDATDRLLGTARDLNGRFVLGLSRLCLRSGRTIVQLRNDDLQDHNLWLEGISTAAAARAVIATAEPGTTAEAEMSLTAGTWRLYCSLPGHENMSRTVTVVD